MSGALPPERRCLTASTLTSSPPPNRIAASPSAPRFSARRWPYGWPRAAGRPPGGALLAQRMLRARAPRHRWRLAPPPRPRDRQPVQVTAYRGRVAHDHAGHTHGHSHALSGDADGSRLMLVLVLILAFMAVEVGVGVISHSLALLSDAAHMLTDAG